ncbi:MAG: SCP2 sterol-binding domain-containing protein [Myxococcota bacterium]
MKERARPPDDITPAEFFTRWVPAQVAGDAERRARLGGTHASIEFVLSGDPGGIFTLVVRDGEVRGFEGGDEAGDLRVRLDVETWRQLNSGSLSAPEAALRRKVRLQGNLLLAIKLHLILG